MSDEEQVQNAKMTKYASPMRSYIPARNSKIVIKRKINKSVAHSELDGRFSSNDENLEEHNRLSEGGGPTSSKNEYYIGSRNNRPQSNRIENSARPLVSKKLPIEFNSVFSMKTEPKSKKEKTEESEVRESKNRMNIFISLKMNPESDAKKPERNKYETDSDHRSEEKADKPKDSGSAKNSRGLSPGGGKKNESMNPILPVKNFLRLSKQTLMEIGKQNGLKFNPCEELELEGSKRKIAYKMNEMITIDLLSKGGGNNIYKRVLHAPTLNLFVIQEQCFGFPDNMDNLKKWTKSWKENLNDHPNFVKVLEFYWNTPEGCASTLLEYVNGGTLKNLISKCGSLNEKALKQLASSIVVSLKDFKLKCGGQGNYPLSTSSVFLDKKGKIKLSPMNWNFSEMLTGADDRHSDKKMENTFEVKGFISTNESLKTLYRLIRTAERLHASSLPPRRHISLNTPISSHNTSDMIDCLRIGLLVVECVIGELDFFVNELIEAQFFTEASQELSAEAKKHCCYFHLILHLGSEESLGQYIQKRRSSPIMKMIQREQLKLVSELLSRKYSDSFNEFLCFCFSSKPLESNKYSDIVNHPFLMVEGQADGRVQSFSKNNFLKDKQRENVSTPDNDYQAGGSGKVEAYNMSGSQPQARKTSSRHSDSDVKQPYSGEFDEPINGPEIKGPDVSLEEIVKLASIISKKEAEHSHPLLGKSSSFPGEKQLLRICSGLSMVLPTCEEWFGGAQGMKNSKKLWNVFSLKNQAVVDLSLDLGIPPEMIVQKIKRTLTDVSYFSIFRSSVMDL